MNGTDVELAKRDLATTKKGNDAKGPQPIKRRKSDIVFVFGLWEFVFTPREAAKFIKRWLDLGMESLWDQPRRGRKPVIRPKSVSKRV